MATSRGAKKACEAKVFSREYQVIRKNPDLLDQDNNVKRKLSIVHISDTHDVNYSSKSIPCGDLLIHSGDFTNAGDQGDPALVQSFVSWFLRQPHRYKILVCGNHELEFDRKYSKEGLRTYLKCDGPEAAVSNNFSNPILLNDESITIDGIKFYGSSWNTCSMAWSAYDEGARKKIWSWIPRDTDILITHQPPLGHMDLAWQSGIKGHQCQLPICKGKKHSANYCHWGCHVLLEAVTSRNIPLHCFGHVHDAHGFSKDDAATSSSTVYSNAAMDIHQTPNLIEFYYIAKQQQETTEECKENTTEVGEQKQTDGNATNKTTVLSPYELVAASVPRKLTPFQIQVTTPGCPIKGLVLDVDAYSAGKKKIIAWEPLDPRQYQNQAWALESGIVAGAAAGGGGTGDPAQDSTTTIKFTDSLLSMDSDSSTGTEAGERCIHIDTHTGQLLCGRTAEIQQQEDTRSVKCWFNFIWTRNPNKDDQQQGGHQPDHHFILEILPFQQQYVQHQSTAIVARAGFVGFDKNDGFALVTDRQAALSFKLWPVGA